MTELPDRIRRLAIALLLYGERKDGLALNLNQMGFDVSVRHNFGGLIRTQAMGVRLEGADWKWTGYFSYNENAITITLTDYTGQVVHRPDLVKHPNGSSDLALYHGAEKFQRAITKARTDKVHHKEWIKGDALAMWFMHYGTIDSIVCEGDEATILRDTSIATTILETFNKKS